MHDIYIYWSAHINAGRRRAAIRQVLCASTNPLGKCMDYVHEDLGLMNRELEKWQSDARKSTDQLEVEKEKTEAEMAPLRMELTEADEKVSKRSLLLARADDGYQCDSFSSSRALETPRQQRNRH